MNFRDVCELLSGDAPGELATAASQLGDSGSSAHEALFDWVHAELVDRGVDLDDDETVAIQKIVSLAMLSQRHCDEDLWRAVFKEAARA
jgi:hypothetical protein